MTEFPTASFGGEEVTFKPGLICQSPRFVLLFAWCDSGVILVDIEDRGWTIPGGHVEVGETPVVAMHREAWEEAGLVCRELRPLGAYVSLEGAERSQVFVSTDWSLEGEPSLESKATQVWDLSKIPEIYSFWNALTEAVFAYSKRSI